MKNRNLMDIKPSSMLYVFGAVALLGLIGANAHAAEESAQKPAANAGSDTGAEQVDVDAIKQKYWARGDESELGVVQNRLYSKEKKIETQLFVGTSSSDPFLSVRTLGGGVGFHFSEYLSAGIVGWKNFVNPSSALETFEQTLGASTNNNPPRWFIGAEGKASILYGKLSLVGKSIIYYDLHLSAGLGATRTDNGTYATPSVGVGQQIYLNKFMSLNVDYRAQMYRETIYEKVNTFRLGQNLGTRTNWTHSIMLGVSFLFGPGSAAPAGSLPTQGQASGAKQEAK